MKEIMELKQRLIIDEDFGDIFDCFYDLMEGDTVSFREMKPKEFEILMVIVTAASRAMIQDPNMYFVNFRMFNNSKNFLQHGMATSNKKKKYVFFFFTDIDKGMITTMKSSEEALFSRVTGKRQPLTRFDPNQHSN